MPPEEIDYFRSLGHAFIGALTLVSTYSLLYGVFILLFSISTWSLFRRGQIRRPILVMFAATLVTFLISTMNVAAEVAGFSIFLHSALVTNVELPLDDSKRSTANSQAVFTVIAQWNANIVPLLSDVVIIWRAWVLFPEKRRVLIAPLCLFLGSIGTSFAYLGLIFKSKVADSVFEGPFDSSTKMLSLASIAVSMVTNAAATSFIAYNLWSRHRTNNDKPGPEIHRLQRFTALLVESGFGLLCFQFVQLIVGRTRPLQSAEAQHLTWLVFTASYYGLSAMYPTIVILLVHNRRSIADFYGSNSTLNGPARSGGARPATIGHISFALRPLSTQPSQDRPYR